MAKNESVFIKEAFAYYAQIKSPGALKYQQVADKDNELINKEYVIEILPNVKELKALKKKYKKNVKLLRESKQYTAEEFKARFKVDPPTDSAFETDDDGDIVYETIKVRKYAAYQKGEPTRLVEIFGAKKAKGVDRNDVAVSQEIQDPKTLKIIGGESTLIGNGSLIRVQLTIRDLNTKSGTDQQFDLYAIQVLELVVFESDGPTDGFDDEDGDFESEGGFGDEDEGDGEPSEEETEESGAGAGTEAAEADEDDDF